MGKRETVTVVHKRNMQLKHSDALKASRKLFMFIDFFDHLDFGQPCEYAVDFNTAISSF